MSPNRTLFYFIGAGLLLLVWQQPASADMLMDAVVICDQGSPCQTLDQSTTGPASASSTFTFGAGTASVMGSADAAGGILRAFSSFSLTAAAPITGQVSGNAQINDRLTINALGFDGTTGYLQPEFAVTGSTSGPANAQIVVFADANASNCPGTSHCQTQYVTGNSEVVFNPIAFTFGQPIAFGMVLGAATYFGPGGELNAVSDFSHTAVLNGLGIFENSNGTDPVPNPTFTSADGIEYSVNGIVPEPNSLPLLASGLAFLVLVYRRAKTL